MSNNTKKLIKILIVYLIISSMYIVVRISYEEPVFYENLLFEETSVIHNIIRVIMGIPPVSKGYGECASPKFMIEVIIKIIIAIILLIYLLYDKAKNKTVNKEINILNIIAKTIVIFILLGIYLLNLYITYIGVHYTR